MRLQGTFQIWHLFYRAKDRNGVIILDEEGNNCIRKGLEYHAKAMSCENRAMREVIPKNRGTCLLDAKNMTRQLKASNGLWGVNQREIAVLKHFSY